MLTTQMSPEDIRSEQARFNRQTLCGSFHKRYQVFKGMETGCLDCERERERERGTAIVWLAEFQIWKIKHFQRRSVVGLHSVNVLKSP